MGRFSGTAEAAQWVKIKQVVRPNPAAQMQYEDYYQIYRELYTSTRPLMQRLNGLTQGS